MAFIRVLGAAAGVFNLACTLEIGEVAPDHLLWSYDVLNLKKNISANVYAEFEAWEDVSSDVLYIYMQVQVWLH